MLLDIATHKKRAENTEKFLGGPPIPELVLANIPSPF